MVKLKQAINTAPEIKTVAQATDFANLCETAFIQDKAVLVEQSASAPAELTDAMNA